MSEPNRPDGASAEPIDAGLAEEGRSLSLADALSAARNPQSRRAIFAVPVEVVVSVGRAHPPIGELINMRRDAVIMLDRHIDDPVDIRIGDRVVARGELQELQDGSGRLGVRMTEIVDGESGQ